MIDLTASADALAALKKAVTTPLVSRRRKRSRRYLYSACNRTHFRTRLSPYRCPHCHSDALAEVAT